MDSFLSKIDPPIDYIGQSFSLKLMRLVFIVGYSIAFLVGLAMSNLKYTLILGIVTCAVCFLLTVPAWPYFRRHPLKFKKVVKEKRE